jgi:hypothetical protein
MAMATIQNGASCFFWLDLWDGQLLQHTFSELFSFCRDTTISVQTIKSATTTITLFHLSLSIEAYEQFQQLDIIIQNIQLTLESDQWRYI